MSQSSSEEDVRWPSGPNFPVDAFSGTARYYARYRPPYPRDLIEDICVRASITGKGRLLDLACGPGRVALPFSTWFKQVWAIDLEPEMIEVGKEEAIQGGVQNIHWMVGRAEELEAESGSFELVTIGEAFHRLDQGLIAHHSMEWLQPDGCLVTMGGMSLTRGKEPWLALVAEVRDRWFDRRENKLARYGQQTDVSRSADQTRRVLEMAGFTGIESHEFTQPIVWTVDSIIGNLYSTSVASRRLLGDKVAAFEADLRRTLMDYDASGSYRASQSFGYTLARKPAKV